MDQSKDKIIFIENESIHRDSSGGVMSYILNLSSYLMNNGFQTMLIGSGASEVNGSPMNKFTKFYSISEKPVLSNLRFFLKLLNKKNLKEIGRNDIIHVHRPEMVLPVSLWLGNRIICTLHGGQDQSVLVKKGKIMGFIYLMIQFIAFKIVDQIIVVDSRNLERFVKKYPWIKEKSHLIPIGVNNSVFYSKSKMACREKFNLSRSRKILLFIGRLEYEKNIEFLIEGFKEISEKEIDLIIAGEGSLKEKLRELPDTDYKDIRFLGEVRNSMIPDLINSSDILLLTSIFEGSPTVVKEALCCNVPVISTDVGDVKEVLDLVDGGEIIDYNVKSFKNAVLRLLSNEKRTFKEASKLFSHELMAKRTLKVYNLCSKS